jgi:plastocyanin
MKQSTLLGWLFSLSIITSPALADEFEVGQKNKSFTLQQLKLKVGDTVKFSNGDPFYHNIFSLSEAKPFDLGSFKKGNSRTVTFDKPGKIEVECAIHPEMHMVIDITE